MWGQNSGIEFIMQVVARKLAEVEWYGEAVFQKLQEFMAEKFAGKNSYLQDLVENP
jgi:hypothetical protein